MVKGYSYDVKATSENDLKLLEMGLSYKIIKKASPNPEYDFYTAAVASNKRTALEIRTFLMQENPVCDVKIEQLR
ncbi:MAG: hypothetical protein PHV39_00780 [Methanomicrobium sp.]|nr:hypothetical protein [Methanomicrobium sp.]